MREGSRAAPHVVIVGGYLTEPVFYRPMRARLLERGAARVTIVPIHLPDWLAAAFTGFGRLFMRTGRIIRAARSASDAAVIVVGHSAGGILARLALCPVPFDGRCAKVGDAVGCIVSLGTPQVLRPHAVWRGHAGEQATRFLAQAPTTPVPGTRSLTVGSVAVPPRGDERSAAPTRLLNRVLSSFVGPSPTQAGDGIVTEDQTRLDGVRHITLVDTLHGTFGGPWYGDGHVIDRWWPAALEEWRLALAERDATPSIGGEAVHAHPDGESDGESHGESSPRARPRVRRPRLSREPLRPWRPRRRRAGSSRAARSGRST